MRGKGQGKGRGIDDATTVYVRIIPYGEGREGKGSMYIYKISRTKGKEGTEVQNIRILEGILKRYSNKKVKMSHLVEDWAQALINAIRGTERKKIGAETYI